MQCSSRFLPPFPCFNPSCTTCAQAAALLLVQSAAAQSCDRDCLRGTITTYLNAMLKHDPKGLPLAASLRFTEDTQELKLGEGLWKHIESLSGFRQDILDVRKGVAGVHVKAIENGKPVLVAIRLQLQGDKIAGVETMVVRTKEEGMIFNVDAIVKASDAMNVAPTAAQHNTRDDMERLALLVRSSKVAIISASRVCPRWPPSRRK